MCKNKLDKIIQLFVKIFNFKTKKDPTCIYLFKFLLKKSKQNQQQNTSIIIGFLHKILNII